MYFFKGILSAFAFTIIFYNENMKFKEFVKKKLFWVIVILCCISDVYYFKTLFYSNNEFDSNRTIAITTILALLYTIKIHGDNLEFQKRIALRKERLELIEDFKKNWQQIEKHYMKFWNLEVENLSNLFFSDDYIEIVYGNDDDKNEIIQDIIYKIKTKETDDTIKKIIQTEIWKSQYEGGFKAGDYIEDKNEDEIKKEYFANSLQSLSFKNYYIEALFPTKDRYNLFFKLYRILIDVRTKIHNCLPNIKNENNENQWKMDLEISKKYFSEDKDLWKKLLEHHYPMQTEEVLENVGIRILVYHLNGELRQKKEEIKKMKSEMEHKFKKEIAKLQEQAKI